MGGGKLKPRPEGYHREVGQLQRIHDKLRLDETRDPVIRAKICRNISEAISELNALSDREMSARSNGQNKGART